MLNFCIALNCVNVSFSEFEGVNAILGTSIASVDSNQWNCWNEIYTNRTYLMGEYQPMIRSEMHGIEEAFLQCEWELALEKSRNWLENVQWGIVSSQS